MAKKSEKIKIAVDACAPAQPDDESTSLKAASLKAALLPTSSKATSSKATSSKATSSKDTSADMTHVKCRAVITTSAMNEQHSTSRDGTEPYQTRHSNDSQIEAQTIHPLNEFLLTISDEITSLMLKDMKFLVLNLSEADDACNVSLSRSVSEKIDNPKDLMTALHDRVPSDLDLLSLLVDLFDKIKNKALANKVNQFRTDYLCKPTRSTIPVDAITNEMEALNLHDQSLDDHIALLTSCPDDVRQPLKITSKKTLYMTSDRRLICQDRGRSKIIAIPHQQWRKLYSIRDEVEAAYDRYQPDKVPQPDIRVLDMTWVIVSTWFGKTVLTFAAIKRPGPIDTSRGICLTRPSWTIFMDYLQSQLPRDNQKL